MSIFIRLSLEKMEANGSFGGWFQVKEGRYRWFYGVKGKESPAFAGHRAKGRDGGLLFSVRNHRKWEDMKGETGATPVLGEAEGLFGAAGDEEERAVGFATKWGFCDISKRGWRWVVPERKIKSELETRG